MSHTGIDDQMCALIGARGAAIQALVLSRHHGLFTDRQAALLNAGREHLMAAVGRMGQQMRPLLEVAPHLRWVTAAVAIPAVAPNGARELARGSLVGTATTRPAAGRSTHATARQRQILALAAGG